MLSVSPGNNLNNLVFDSAELVGFEIRVNAFLLARFA